MAARGSVARIERLLARVRARGRVHLTEPEAKRMLALAGFAVAPERFVADPRAAASAATRVGFPVVLKVVSPDLPHKASVGGVRLGLDSPRLVSETARQMLAEVRSRCPQARIDGMLVQRQLQGVEVMLGAAVDREFGPLVMFGLGGTAVEALRDVAFRLIPVDGRDARALIEETRAAALLRSDRGQTPLAGVAAALVRLSALVARFRNEIQEIDINPTLVTARGLVAVDALAVLSPFPAGRTR